MRRATKFFLMLLALLVPRLVSASTVTDTNFIDELYEDALNRAPSPSDVSLDLVLLSSISHQQLAGVVLGSTEYQDKLVESYFQSYLSRIPSSSELGSFATLLGSTNDQTVQEDILGSVEFFNDNGGTDAGFVDALFVDLLGRTPKLSEQSFFVSELTGGATDAQVAAQVLGSAEYNGDLLKSYFEQYLDRLPTTADSSFFVPLLEAGGNNETVQADILGTPEYNLVAQEENAPAATPEPASLLLLGTGLLGLGPFLRRRFARTASHSG